MRRLTRPRRILSLTPFVALVGCATINATVDPWARQAGVTAGAPVILTGKVGQVQIFREGSTTPLKVVIVENPSFKTAVGNAVRQSAAEARAGSSPTGTATYTRNMEYAPAVYLQQKQTHRLRIVRPDGREAIVVAKPHVGRGFLIVDWLLVAPTFFTSIVVDAATGKWKVFDPIDVDTIFPTGGDLDALFTTGPSPFETPGPASDPTPAPTVAAPAVPGGHR